MSKEFDLTKALEEVGQLVMESAKANLINNDDVDTGALKDSIHYEVEGNSVIISTSIPYAPYIEYGTGLFAVHGDGRQTPWKWRDRNGNWHTTVGIHSDTMSGHPFLEPALYDNKKKIVKILKHAVLEGLEDYDKHK